MPVATKPDKKSALSPEERQQKREQRWAARAEAILVLRKQGSAKYDEADQILKQLVHKRPRLRAGTMVPYKDGRQLRLKDNYAETDKVYRAHGIGRFEIEVLDANGKVIRNPD